MWRVIYPLLTQDGHRDFDTKEGADKFAAARRNAEGQYAWLNGHRHVQVLDLGDQGASRADLPGITTA